MANSKIIMNCLNNVLLTVNVILILCSSRAAGNMVGPADITVERVEECENPESFEVPLGVTLNKINRTHAGFFGCMDFAVDMDDNVLLNLTAAKWGDGGWKPNAFKYDGQLCSTVMQYIKGPWTTFIQASGKGDPVCPQPKDVYCVEKLIVELTGLFPSMLYGYFRTDMMILIGEKRHRCLRMFIKSEPAKKGSNVG